MVDGKNNVWHVKHAHIQQSNALMSHFHPSLVCQHSRRQLALRPDGRWEGVKSDHFERACSACIKSQIPTNVLRTSQWQLTSRFAPNPNTFVAVVSASLAVEIAWRYTNSWGVRLPAVAEGLLRVANGGRNFGCTQVSERVAPAMFVAPPLSSCCLL